MSKVTGVFQGGGIKGIALSGAAAAALDHGYEFDQAVGTSAGAIVASLVAVGFDSGGLRDVVAATKWPNLQPSSNWFQKNFSMVVRRGFHDGSHIEALIGSLLATKGVETFGDMPAEGLKVVATDLTHARGFVLPDDLPGVGIEPSEFPVARAVRMSSSVPFVFDPVRLVDQNTGEEMMMADGAMAARFPAQLVPRSPTSIGFRFKPPSVPHTHYEVKGPISLVTAVIASGITARDDLPLACGPLERLIEIDLDHDAMDFDVDRDRALAMFDLGYSTALAQLDVPIELMSTDGSVSA